MRGVHVVGPVQVNKAQYKEADCARELKRGSIMSYFSPSPKKKAKLEGSQPATVTTTMRGNALSSKAEPGVKSEPLSSVKPESKVKNEPLSSVKPENSVKHEQIDDRSKEEL